MMLDLDDITHLNARDVLAAVPDAVGLVLGAHAIRNPHPFAELVAESPLRAAAYAAGQILNPRRPGEVEAAVIGRGLRTLEFGNAVAAALQTAARRKYDVQAAHRSVVADVEIDKIGLPQPTGAVAMATPLGDVTDGAEYEVTRATVGDGEPIELNSFGRLVEVSRPAIFNDDLDLLREAIAETGVAAARHEARLVASALEANPNLTDGSAVFHADYGNISASAFDAAGLAAAMAALRTQPAADSEALDAAATALLVAPDLEFTARKLAHESGIPLEVRVLTGLAAGRYYLTASPDVSRSIAVARLAGQSHPLAVEPVRAPLEFDGALLRIRIDTGSAMIGRRGIVKGGA